MKRSSLIVVMFAAALLATGLRPSGTRADAPPPTRLAVVNIMKVFSALDERRDSENEIVKLSEDMTKQKEALEKLVDEDQKTLKALSVESKGYEETGQKLLKDTMDLKALLGMMEQRMMMEQRLRTMKLYRHINDTIAEYSKANGIALVLVIEDPDLSTARDMEQLLSRVATRKVLYADSSLDITKALITQMNSTYASTPKSGG